MIVDLTLSYAAPPSGTDPIVLKVSCDADDVVDHLGELDATVAGGLVLTIDVRTPVAGHPAPGDVVHALVTGTITENVSMVYKGTSDWQIETGVNPRALLRWRAAQGVANVHWVGAVRPSGPLPSTHWAAQGATLLALHATLRKAWRSALG